MASMESVLAEVAALRQQHAHELTQLSSRLGGIEDSLHQLLLQSQSSSSSAWRGGTSATAAAAGPAMLRPLAAQSMGGPCGGGRLPPRPPPHTSSLGGGLGRSSVPAGGAEMQHHMQHAIEMQHPLRSLRQADTSHGGEDASHSQQQQQQQPLHYQPQHYPQQYTQQYLQHVAPKPFPEEGDELQGGVALSPRKQPPQPQQYTQQYTQSQQYSGAHPPAVPLEQQYTPPPRNVAFAAQSPLDEAIEKLHLLSDEARTGDQIMAEEHAEGEQNTARSCFHTMYQVRGGI